MGLCVVDPDGEPLTSMGMCVVDPVPAEVPFRGLASPMLKVAADVGRLSQCGGSGLGEIPSGFAWREPAAPAPFEGGDTAEVDE
jgi:hypothetical protein